MSDPFLAEIRIFTGNFAPRGWALCDGQLMAISQNTALFSLLGTTYGGDGRSTFALPNLQGCSPLQAGQGPGLTPRDLGETGGEQTVALLSTEMASHSHTFQASSNVGDSASPANNVLAKSRWFLSAANRGAVAIYNTPQSQVQMGPLSTSVVGGSLPHNNLMPFLGLNFIIALQGVFPARS
ncbi:MAG TPA: tail fiber protein [Xanthobacteraceae bacterium]|jgi:microcystin-dependent protein